MHEIKPEACGDWSAANAAARRFALGLVRRRLLASSGNGEPTLVLWCMSARHACQVGRPYGPGLASLGLDPTRLILVEAARETDVLWAIEEGLKSQALALVLGEVGEAALTPARRLALAAAAGETPCLLLTSATSGGAASTATRWRIGPAASARQPFDPHAPGAPRCTAVLERCRNRPASHSMPLALEWSDDGPPGYRRLCGGLSEPTRSPVHRLTG